MELDQHCINHPDAWALGQCEGCGEAFCWDCLNKFKGMMLCTPCMTEAIHERHRRDADASGKASALPDLRCHRHPRAPAAGQCDRCGDYVCWDCLNKLQGVPLCRRCLVEVIRRSLPSKLRLTSIPMLIVAALALSVLILIVLWIL